MHYSCIIMFPLLFNQFSCVQYYIYTCTFVSFPLTSFFPILINVSFPPHVFLCFSFPIPVSSSLFLFLLPSLPQTHTVYLKQVSSIFPKLVYVLLHS